MFKKIFFILECSRVFSLPMTVFSWLVAYSYAVKNSGNLWFGLLALAGICLAHLGANTLDDLFDYKSLIKRVDFDKKEYLKNTQKTKCRYIVSGMLNESDVVSIILTYFGLAGLIGLFFFIRCGTPVLYYGIGAGIIILLYSFLSRIRMSEIAIALVYGPLLFGGVIYVMTKIISSEVFIL